MPGGFSRPRRHFARACERLRRHGRGTASGAPGRCCATRGGWSNRKRVQRLWREEGLRVPASVLKRRRLGTSTVPASRLSAERPNHVWALDFIFDATSDGRPIKALSMCDEFTRENLARRLGRSITADEVIHALDDACVVRGAPEFIRMDNGPEFVAMAIRDWCREHGTGTAYIEPGSPWQNPYVESFNGKLRDEPFSREVFDTIREARLRLPGARCAQIRVRIQHPPPRRQRGYGIDVHPPARGASPPGQRRHRHVGTGTSGANSTVVRTTSASASINPGAVFRDAGRR
jgi:putative transposase